MAMEKEVKNYTRLYRKALEENGLADAEGRAQAYANLTRHVEFVRHSDLSDGDACHDEIMRR